MIPMRRSQHHARAVIQPQTAAFGLLLTRFQALLTSQPLHQPVIARQRSPLSNTTFSLTQGKRNLLL
jgi:hypothetical protein